MYKLITIAFSHYNEKARWGLERFAQPDKESEYMPLLHMPAVAWATRGAADAGHTPRSLAAQRPTVFGNIFVTRTMGGAFCRGCASFARQHPRTRRSAGAILACAWQPVGAWRDINSDWKR